MSKLIAFLLVCFLSFGASAQDVRLSFGGTTLSSRETNITNSTKLLKDNKLKSETGDYKVISYVISILPKNGDLVGPFTITAGKEMPVEVRNTVPNASGSKIFFDDIVIQGPDGKKRKSINYLVVCQ